MSLIPDLRVENHTLRDERSELHSTLYGLACYLRRADELEAALRTLGPQRAQAVRALVAATDAAECDDL